MSEEEDFEKIENIYDELITEIRENRNQMSEMLETAIEFRKRVSEIIPKNSDFKNKWVLEEKMKLIVSIFGVELDIRKQKEASLKSEIEMRRKISGDDEKNADANAKDVIQLAKAIEILEGKKQPKYETEAEIPRDE